jgi:hypothetical protein
VSKKTKKRIDIMAKKSKTKKRTEVELLKLLRDVREGIVGKFQHKVYKSVGLCSLVKWTYEDEMITFNEYEEIIMILKKHRPRGACVGTHWFPYDGVKRGEFLDKLIKKLEVKL